MRIFIAESDQDLRMGLQMLFRQEPGMYVSGMAIESEGLLVQVEASRADVLLLDWHLPGVSAVILVADIQGLRSPPKTIILSINSEDKRPAISAGADAFISKNKSPNELLEVVRSLSETTVNSTG